MLELDKAEDFRAAFDVEFFEALPAQPGVFLLTMKAVGAQPYLARTADIRAAATRLLGRPGSGIEAAEFARCNGWDSLPRDRIEIRAVGRAV